MKAVLARPIPFPSPCPNPELSFFKTGCASSISPITSDRTGFNCSTTPRPKSAALLFILPVIVDISPAPEPASFPAAPPKKSWSSPDTPENPFFLNSSAETLKPKDLSRSVSPTFKSPRASMASMMEAVPPLAAAISSASVTRFMASVVLPPASEMALEPAWMTSPVSKGVALAFSLSC